MLDCAGSHLGIAECMRLIVSVAIYHVFRRQSFPLHLLMHFVVVRVGSALSLYRAQHCVLQMATLVGLGSSPPYGFVCIADSLELENVCSHAVS